MGRADGFESAAPAGEAGLWRELPRADIGRNLLNGIEGFLELFGVARRDLRLISLQVMEHEPHGV